MTVSGLFRDRFTSDFPHSETSTAVQTHLTVSISTSILVGNAALFVIGKFIDPDRFCGEDPHWVSETGKSCVVAYEEDAALDI